MDRNYEKIQLYQQVEKYSTARMLVDYTNKYYMPLAKLYKKYYTNIENVAEYNAWKKT